MLNIQGEAAHTASYDNPNTYEVERRVAEKLCIVRCSVFLLVHRAQSLCIFQANIQGKKGWRKKGFPSSFYFVTAKLQNAINSCGLTLDKFLFILFTFTGRGVFAFFPRFRRFCNNFFVAVEMKELNGERAGRRFHVQASVDPKQQQNLPIFSCFQR